MIKKIISIIVYLIQFCLIDIYAQLPITFTNFPILPDTSRTIAFGGAGVPIIADLDKDGQNEFIICGSNYSFSSNVLYVIKNDGKFFNGFPKSLSDYPVNSAVGDVNGDGFLDIAIRDNTHLNVIDRFGNNLPGFPVTFINNTNEIYHYPLSLFDLDNDGKLESIVININSSDVSIISVYNYDGQIRQGWPKIINYCVDNPALGDINGDGKGEIVICDYIENVESHIRIFKDDGSNYSSNWPVTIDSSYSFYGSSPSLFINKTNYDSVFIYAVFIKGFYGNYVNKLIKVNKNGVILNTTYQSPTTDGLGTLAMGDINNDGRIELATGDQYFGNVALYNDGLILMPGWPRDGAGNHHNTVTIGKVKYGEELQVIANRNPALYEAFIYCMNFNGENINWSPIRLNGQMFGFTFNDLNNDGNTEMITSGEDYGGIIHTFTISGIPFNVANYPWPMWCHDRYRTNQYGFVPPDEPNAIKQVSNNLPEQVLLYQNYPNPFNPYTAIKFELPYLKGHDNNIKLVIYNSLGQELERLLDKPANELKPGTYEINWNACLYSSGIYFYTLIYGSYIQTRKMVLIK